MSSTKIFFRLHTFPFSVSFIYSIAILFEILFEQLFEIPDLVHDFQQVILFFFVASFFIHVRFFISVNYENWQQNLFIAHENSSVICSKLPLEWICYHNKFDWWKYQHWKEWWTGGFEIIKGIKALKYVCVLYIILKSQGGLKERTKWL